MSFEISTSLNTWIEGQMKKMLLGVHIICYKGKQMDKHILEIRGKGIPEQFLVRRDGN